MMNTKWIKRLSVLMTVAGLAIAPAAFGQAQDHDDHDHEPAHAPATAPATQEAHCEHCDEHADGHHDHDHDHAHEAAHDHGHHEHGHADHHGHADEVHLSPQAIEAAGIRVERAARHALNRTVLAPGRVAFNTEQMAHVGSAVAGRVAEVRARLGDTVRKGDVLLVVDSPELGEAQSDFLVKRTAIATAQSAVDAAHGAFERADQLYQQSKGIALSEVQRREAEFKAAQGALLGAQAAATAAENKLHLLGMNQQAVTELERTKEIDPKYLVRAPLDGQIVEREATLGELVSPDRDALLIIANMQTLWVLADVAEAQLDDVRVGTPARIELATRGRPTLEGKVSFIAPQLNPATRTATVRIEVAAEKTSLRPGMFARVRLTPGSDDQQSAVLAVPDAAVQTVEGEPSVFVPVADEPGAFTRRAVKVGPAIAGMIPVLDGLREGERFVSSGSFILKAELGKGSAGHDH